MNAEQRTLNKERRSAAALLPLLPFFLLMTSMLSCYSQDSVLSEEKQITEVINRFFESLEQRDTTLLKSIAMPEGQIWRIYDGEGPEKVNMRFVKDDLLTLHTLPEVKESALDFEIMVHRDIAMAWVPYEFEVEGKFSHCGIDVFTLFRLDGAWKIVSASYSVQKTGCDDLRDEK